MLIGKDRTLKYIKKGVISAQETQDVVISLTQKEIAAAGGPGGPGG